MKLFKNILLGTSILSLLFIFSCGDDNNGDPAPTGKEELQNALVSGTWTVDQLSTDVSSVTGDLNVSTFTIAFTSTGAGAEYSLGGDISPYVSGGAFDISDTGSATNPTIVVDGSLQVDNISGFSVSATSFKINIGTSKSGRVSGIGGYSIAFTAN